MKRFPDAFQGRTNRARTVGAAFNIAHDDWTIRCLRCDGWYPHAPDALVAEPLRCPFRCQPVRPITLCYEASRSDGRVWAVKVGRRWRLASQVVIDGVTLETVYKGPAAKQPRAYLTGHGRVVWQGTQARILP